MSKSWIVALSLLAITVFIIAVMTTVRYIVKARNRRREAAAPPPDMATLPSTTTLASQTSYQSNAALLPGKSPV